jgi:1,4-alpha-glucan branching enzyme
MIETMHPDALQSLVSGDHGNPFELLGPHPVSDETISIRAFCSYAKSMEVVLAPSGDRYSMVRIHDDGFFEITVPGSLPHFAYQLDIETYEGQNEMVADPYAFGPTLSDYDLHLLGEGRHLYSYQKLGAHLMEIDGVTGVSFAVWAPNAYRVSVVGAFNRWDDRMHPMRHIGNGIWNLFIPAANEWDTYKFDLRCRNMGYRAQKSDPYGFGAELRPKTASLVIDIDSYQWSDDEWMQERRKSDPLKQPMMTYEAHMGSWRRKNGNEWLTYREMADVLVAYCKKMGYTHIELMPVAEHPFDGSWGYQITGYFAVTSRYGTPQDFMYFVDTCHQNGIGVILDWVPAHFPKDGHGLSYFDGTHLYEHADSRKGEHPDWGTYIFNYGRYEIRNFLLSNALFWLDKYHIDGLRVDAVSSMLYLDFGRNDGEWLANEYGGNENLDAVSFLREFNEVVHREYPGTVTIAEESTAWPMVSRPIYVGGLGFTLKWNMGWMHDTLDYIAKDPIHRRYHHNSLTFSMMYAFTENFVLSLSHDEVVHLKNSLIGKIPGDWWQKFATLRLLLGYQITHPGKKLLFMGQEFGQWAEWSEERSLDWNLLDFPTHERMLDWSRDLFRFYQSQPALYQLDFDPAGFEWIEPNDSDNSIFSYIRFADDPSDFVVVVFNFTPVPRYDYRIGVPEEGYYAEILNSDSKLYGGSNVGNGGGSHSEPVKWHGRPHSLCLTIPPLAIIILQPKR